MAIPATGHSLTFLCERRIGQPVIAASRIRVRTPNGYETRVVALTANRIMWLGYRPWRNQVGRVIGWRPLTGLAPHTERRRLGGYSLELSWPDACELYTGTLNAGADADEFVGQLTADAFARTSR